MYLSKRKIRALALALEAMENTGIDSDEANNAMDAIVEMLDSARAAQRRQKMKPCIGCNCFEDCKNHIRHGSVVKCMYFGYLREMLTHPDVDIKFPHEKPEKINIPLPEILKKNKDE